MEKKKDSGLHDVLSGLNKKKADREKQETAEKNEAGTGVLEDETVQQPEAVSENSVPVEELREAEKAREELPPEEKKARRLRRKRTKREIRIAVLGVLTSFFVVVGVIASIRFVVDTTKNIVDSTELMRFSRLSSSMRRSSTRRNRLTAPLLFRPLSGVLFWMRI